MEAVTEVYVSCVEQKIEGIVYGVNQVVPRAASLATLPALLHTKRIRLTGFASVSPPAPEPGIDLGSAQSVKPQARRKKTKKASRRARG